MNIGACTGCNQCRTTNRCTIEDGCTSLLGEGIEAIIIGVCSGDDDGMGFTMEAMKRPLQDHGVLRIQEFRYLHTKQMPVWKNESLCGDLETVFSIKVPLEY